MWNLWNGTLFLCSLGNEGNVLPLDNTPHFWSTLSHQWRSIKIQESPGRSKRLCHPSFSLNLQSPFCSESLSDCWLSWVLHTAWAFPRYQPLWNLLSSRVRCSQINTSVWMPRYKVSEFYYEELGEEFNIRGKKKKKSGHFEGVFLWCTLPYC